MSSNFKAVISYLFHSGFALEYEDYFLIFDYYKPPENIMDSGFNKKDLENGLENYKHPFVFVSHGHYDHFNPNIFDWKSYNTNITYIVSNDVLQTNDGMNIDDKHSDVRCFYMSAYEKMEMHGIDISTFGSTDIGVSFMVRVGGLVIFHAGDLNWWHWAEESTQQELEEEERRFKEEVAKIQDGNIDIMFFPVDPRLGEYYWMGGAYMLETLKPRLFVPMHFGDNPEITKDFSEKMKYINANIVVINHPGQSFEYIFSDI